MVLYLAGPTTKPQAILTTGLPQGVHAISFATTQAGWASIYADGFARGRLFATADGGRTWHELLPA